MGVDFAFVHIDQMESFSSGSFARINCFFLQPVQNPLGSGDRLRILTMREVMAWAPIAEAQVVHGPMQRVDAHRDVALALEQRLQIANTPDRHWHIIRVRPLLERRLQERPIGLAQGVRAAPTWAVHQPRAPLDRKALLPNVDAIRRGLQQTRRARLGLAFGDQQQRLRSPSDTWVRIGLRQMAQRCASVLLRLVH